MGGNSGKNMTHSDAINLPGEELSGFGCRADALSGDCLSDPVLLLVNFNLWFFRGKNWLRTGKKREQRSDREIQMRETGLTVSSLLSRRMSYSRR